MPFYWRYLPIEESAQRLCYEKGTIEMSTAELMAQSDHYIMGTYRRFPVVLVKGSGMHVWDSDGKSYLDFVAGIAVCSLGHAHPKIAAAIKEQAETLCHVSNLYYIERQIRFAKMLVDHSFADKAFFCNSGAEANEAAIKLARKYAHEKRGLGKYELITMNESFHGRTLATVTATGQEKFQVGFDPLPEGFKYVPYNDLNSLKAAITDKTAAVLVEPIQGEGGVRIPAKDYLRGIREICDDHGLLLILDEVQTGMGRTGPLFAYEDYGIKPDMMTLAKALANGFPIGALLATDEIASVFVPGTHASTFGGNPVAMAAAMQTLKIMIEDRIPDNSRKMGEYFLEKLRVLQDKHSVIREVRGKGLLIGVELSIEGQDIVNRCMEMGLLINCTSGNILRFVPPLIITEKDIDYGVEIIDAAIKEGTSG
jgi:predicted acetylornithine/succinylornithine family transaminase